LHFIASPVASHTCTFRKSAAFVSSIIALPVGRLILTNQDLINEGITPLLETGKIQQLKDMINKYAFLKKFRPFLR